MGLLGEHLEGAKKALSKRALIWYVGACSLMPWPLTMDGEGDGVLVLSVLGPQPVYHRARQCVRGKEDWPVLLLLLLLLLFYYYY